MGDHCQWTLGVVSGPDGCATGGVSPLNVMTACNLSSGCTIKGAQERKTEDSGVPAMKLPVILLFPFLFPVGGLTADNPRNCIGSVPVATFQIRVLPADSGMPLPIRGVNTIHKGYRIACTTLRLPTDLKKNGRITLVVVPVSTDSGDGVTVLDSKAPDGTAEWTMPFQARLVLFVFGPQGLDEKRVSKLVSKDDDLVSELATYANQTESLEDTIDALAAIEDSDEDEIAPRTSAPTDQVLFALTRALNPVMAAYNPLGAGRRMGPATLMGQASEAFFENAGGFVPGGGALPMVKSWLMPDTEFHTVYAEPAFPDGLTLCAQRKTAGSHNRYVYLWAHRLTNSGPPNISLAQPVWLPLSARSTVPIKVKAIDEWPLVDRVREWTFFGGAAPFPVKAHSDGRRSIEFDLRKASAAPGSYHLQGKWDWGTVQVAGDFHLAPLANAAAINLATGSQSLLVEGRGVVPLRLEGADFEFVERVSLSKAGVLGGTPTDLDYVLPVGPRAGQQQSLEVEIDTNHFRRGSYRLALVQAGGYTQDVPVRVLPPLPAIENLPLRVNIGAKDFRLLLRGSRLERIERLTAEHATLRLGDPAGAEREVFVSLDASAKKGDHLALVLDVAGVAEAARLPAGILVAGPRPQIVGLKLSPPEDLGATLREGELPAGSFVGMSVQAQNLDAQAALRLECAESTRMLQPIRVRVGERRAVAKLDTVGDESLFASFDPGAVGTSGCTVKAMVETESAGTSDPVAVGRVVRLPRIETITLTNEKLDSGYAAILTGRDLEAIEKTGWDSANGVPVAAGPPRTLSGEGDRQTLRIVVPWPSPAPMAPLFVWLRGDREGRPVPRR
jgi:hypothetical protein